MLSFEFAYSNKRESRGQIVDGAEREILREREIQRKDTDYIEREGRVRYRDIKIERMKKREKGRRGQGKEERESMRSVYYEDERDVEGESKK